MWRLLIVGDPHVTAEELRDSECLLELVRDTAEGENVDAILFLGDLYHTHSIVNVEVMAFWRRWFVELAKSSSIFVLLGNHDMPGNESSKAHALMAHEDQERVTVVDTPRTFELVTDGAIAFVPYMSNSLEFLKAATALGGKTLICHQTFTGSRFDNGMYAPDGADSNLLPQEFVISGHIHTPQSFGKVWYPGAPRWRTLSDANVSRAIWLVTFDDSGKIVDKKSFDTGGACRQIRFCKVTPVEHEGQLVPAFEPRVELKDGNPIAGVDWRFDIEGPSAFVETTAKWLQGPGRRVRTQVTDAPQAKLKESMGISEAFREHMKTFQPKYGTQLMALEKLALERLGWQ
jgi:DNA repair exonuclease SbcCD nuclease subunit